MVEFGRHLAYLPIAMATLGALVETVAAVEGIGGERVAAIARAIREADLIATHGRGPSAARMTEIDAANLLLAVNGANTARAAPEAVRRFRRLRFNQLEFGRVLEEIIAAAIKSELDEYLYRLYGLSDTERYKKRIASQVPDLKIEFEPNRPSATIECRNPALATPMPMPFFPQKSTVRALPDRCTSITQRTILAIAEIIRK